MIILCTISRTWRLLCLTVICENRLTLKGYSYGNHHTFIHCLLKAFGISVIELSVEFARLVRYSFARKNQANATHIVINLQREDTKSSILFGEVIS